ncbi:MAG: phage tail family protein [Clostridia bacterium]|nr:phage tail family protein [Clostridia bacterium]
MILIFTLKIKNYKNEIYELTHDYDHYYVKSITGLTPPPTTINTTVSGIHDGSYYNSSRMQQRNIVITLGLRGDVEKNRQHLYSIFPLKKECTVYYQNQNRNLKINGFIETLEADIFVQQEDVQISIICPNPYFEGISTIDSDIRKVQPLFEFPFSITEPIPFGNIMRVPTCSLNNIGDVDCGCIFHFRFYEYTNYLYIKNEVTHEYMDLQHAGFQDGDELFINTNFGNLRIIHYSADGSEHNLLPFLKKVRAGFILKQV